MEICDNMVKFCVSLHVTPTQNEKNAHDKRLVNRKISGLRVQARACADVEGTTRSEILHVGYRWVFRRSKKSSGTRGDFASRANAVRVI